jgi:hypothetical protein
MSYRKTGDVENKISAESLNNRTTRNGGILGCLTGDEKIFCSKFWECGSEKGCTRISTGNRVTRWKNCFWGNSRILR